MCKSWLQQPTSILLLTERLIVFELVNNAPYSPALRQLWKHLARVNNPQSLPDSSADLPGGKPAAEVDELIPLSDQSRYRRGHIERAKRPVVGF